MLYVLKIPSSGLSSYFKLGMFFGVGKLWRFMIFRLIQSSLLSHDHKPIKNTNKDDPNGSIKITAQLSRKSIKID